MSRDFPVPAGALIVTSCGRDSSNARCAASMSCARSDVRPTNGPALRRAGASLAIVSRVAQRTGSGLPLRSSARGAPNRKRGPAASIVRAPTTISPGTAVCCSRAATFTASPVTRKSRPGSRAAITSPVLTPIRNPRAAVAPSAATASRSATAALSARSGSSSWARGTPKTAMTASPMNFSSVPPRSAITRAAMS